MFVCGVLLHQELFYYVYVSASSKDFVTAKFLLLLKKIQILKPDTDNIIIINFDDSVLKIFVPLISSVLSFFNSRFSVMAAFIENTL